MKISMEVDFLCRLYGTGWSMFVLYLETDQISMLNTHIHNNPIEELITAINKILKGENHCSFNCYQEPGGYLWEINKEKKEEVLTITIKEFNEGWGDEYTNAKLLSEFKVQASQFVVLVYYQMKKLAMLLKEKDYNKLGSSNRDFPFTAFKEMERLVQVKYSFT